MRALFIIVVASAALTANAQQSQVSSARIGSGEAISTARIADPNELVAVNGRLVKMADLTALTSSLDNVEAQNLRIQEMRIGEKTSPALPLKDPSSKCSGQAREGQVVPCPLDSPTGQVPASTHQPK